MGGRRTSGVLLHPTSLPGPYGIGDIGPIAIRWIDLLAESGTSLWQILPLGPTGFGDSPYASASSYAGNPNLVSPEWLIAHGLVHTPDQPQVVNSTSVDYLTVTRWKQQLLVQAVQQFTAGQGDPGLVDRFEQFRENNSWWLDDFAIYTALKEIHNQRSWTVWPTELRTRRPEALDLIRREASDRIELAIFTQFAFHQQWSEVLSYADQRSIKIIGDIPIYVAPDSVDVWARPELFAVDSNGLPELVGGVPPDQFTDDGQVWGNPLYQWDRHIDEGYSWWTQRFQAALKMADIVRIDHFRAFADYWELPANASNGINGVWRDGPGQDLFNTLQSRLGSLPVIAEDLGDNRNEVDTLLETTGFPGMRLLQFAWDTDTTDPFLPHNYPENTVAYTGTHDNNTTLGWWSTTTQHNRERAAEYLKVNPEDPVSAFLVALWESKANTVIVPLQDLLRLGTESRMNTPGTVGRNWTWRATKSQLASGFDAELADLNTNHHRQ